MTIPGVHGDGVGIMDVVAMVLMMTALVLLACGVMITDVAGGHGVKDDGVRAFGMRCF